MIEFLSFKIDDMKPYQILSLVLLFCLLPVISHAQNSREEEIAKKKVEKSNNLKPNVPGRAEVWVTRLTGPRNGFYPFFGSAFSGGGFALGPGYWKPYGDSSILDIHGAWSVENYRMAEVYSLLPVVANGTLHSEVKAKYVHAGHVSFNGLGNDTKEEDETNFAYLPTTVTFTETFRPHDKIFFGGGSLEYMFNNVGPGDSGSTPSSDEVFNPVTAPGIGTDPEYVNTGLFAAIDWRESPGYTTSGGYYRFDFHNYNHMNGDDNFNFRRYDLELDQYVPVLRANQIIAVRALFSFTDTDAGNEVPFFLTPRLGGSKELRGFHSFRFRDRNRMLLSAEYRWTPSKFLDMALFYETGKVASTKGDLNFEDLHDSYGIGARFHAPFATVLRIELAHSSESTRIIFDTGLVF